MNASNAINCRTATASQIEESLVRLWESNETANIAADLVGPPGIGKTDITEQVAKRLNAQYWVVLTTSMDPTDVQGVPMVIKDDNGNQFTKFMPVEEFQRLTFDDGPRIVVCFDDWAAGNEQVLKTLFRPFHNWEIGGHKMRSNVHLCATSNRMEDQSGAIEIPAALGNRVISYHMAVNSEDWLNWAQYNSVHPSVISYIRQRPNRLHEFDPDKERRSFPTPRSVVNAGKIHKVFDNKDDMVLLNLALSGVVGTPWAVDYLAFVENELALVAASEIISDPENCRLPAQIDAAYATLDSLIYYIQEHREVEHIVKALTYINRLHQNDLKVATIKSIINKVIVKSSDIKFKGAVFSHPIMKEFTNIVDKYIVPGSM